MFGNRLDINVYEIYIMRIMQTKQNYINKFILITLSPINTFIIFIFCI